MKSALTGKTILVTGGTGSIGSQIVSQLLCSDVRRVIVFSRDEIKHFMMRRRFDDDRLQTVVGDVRNPRGLADVFGQHRIDAIFHAAAMKHVVVCEESPLESVETNVIGTQNVVDAALTHDVAKMITISTDKASFPTSVMGATKLIAESMTLNGNFRSGGRQKFACVRFGNVASSRGSVIPVFVDNLLHRRPLYVTDPRVTRFIMEIPSAAKLVIEAADCVQGGEIFILKMKAFKLGDLVQVMCERIAPLLKIAEKGISVKQTGLVAGEKLHEELINDDEATRLYELDDKYVIVKDARRASRCLGLTKAALGRYCSADAELLSHDEIERLIVKYLKSASLIALDVEVEDALRRSQYGRECEGAAEEVRTAGEDLPHGQASELRGHRDR